MLIATDLRCQKGYNLLFSGLSFAVKSGNILQITGVNGSGKTSLLRIIAGLSELENGSILLDKIPPKTSFYQQQIFYFGHLSALSNNLSVLENLAFLVGLNSTSSSINLASALGKMGLENYLFEQASNLSAGQKRRVILAALHLIKSKLWLLDEPFAALDQNGVKIVENCIKTHTKNGGICIYTTHQSTDLVGQTLAL